MEHSNEHSVLGKIWIKFFRERGLKTSEASALFNNIDDMYKSAHNEYTSFSNFYPLFLITHFGRKMYLYRNELDIVEGVYRPIYTLFLIFLDEENLTNQFTELLHAKYRKKMSLDEYIAHILGVVEYLKLNNLYFPKKAHDITSCALKHHLPTPIHTLALIKNNIDTFDLKPTDNKTRGN